MKYKKVEQLIYSMLTTNTGIHFMDSGGDSGRAWQRNQGKTIEDFASEDAVYLDCDPKDCKTSDELTYGISVFHFLSSRVELDEYCVAYNKLQCLDWEGEYYGVSKKQQAWLERKGFVKGDRKSWNTYNWDSNLSQVLQGTELTNHLTGEQYVLLQIHGGADVRGGYTDANLFKVKENGYGADGLLLIEDVEGGIDGVYVSNRYAGTSLFDENGNIVSVKKNSKIKLYLSEP